MEKNSCLCFIVFITFYSEFLAVKAISSTTNKDAFSNLELSSTNNNTINSLKEINQSLLYSDQMDMSEHTPLYVFCRSEKHQIESVLNKSPSLTLLQLLVVCKNVLNTAVSLNSDKPNGLQEDNSKNHRAKEAITHNNFNAENTQKGVDKDRPSAETVLITKLQAISKDQSNNAKSDNFIFRPASRHSENSKTVSNNKNTETVERNPASPYLSSNELAFLARFSLSELTFPKSSTLKSPPPSSSSLYSLPSSSPSTSTALKLPKTPNMSVILSPSKRVSSGISNVEQFRQTSTACRHIAETKLVVLPGCVPKSVLTTRCQGTCHSRSVPEWVQESQELRYFAHCTCCAPNSMRYLDIRFRCPGRTRGHAVKRIAYPFRCACRPCAVAAEGVAE